MAKDKTYILVNHLQSAYLRAFSSDEQSAIVNAVESFVEKARPYVDGVIWAYAEHSYGQVGEFNFNAERMSVFHEGDTVLKNENGRGEDITFLKAFNENDVNQVILAGTFFDSCSTTTSCSLAKNLGITVFVPPSLSDAPFTDSPSLMKNAITQMKNCGVDTSTTTEELLETLVSEQTPKSKTANKVNSTYAKPREPQGW